MNEEHRRAPGADRSHGRRLVRQLGELRRDVLAIPIVGGPIMHSVQIHTGGEQIGIAPEPHGRQISAVASAPESDAPRIHIVPRLQIMPRGDDILVFRCSPPRAARRHAERAPVPNTAAIIQHQHDVSAAREVLIHGVGIRVVVHVMPAQQHLPNRAAVQKNDRRPPFAGLEPRGQEKLRVQLEPVR